MASRTQFSTKTTVFLAGELSDEEGAEVHGCAEDRSMNRIAVESVSLKSLNLKKGMNIRLNKELKLVEPDLKMQTMNWRHCKLQTMVRCS